MTSKTNSLKKIQFNKNIIRGGQDEERNSLPYSIFILNGNIKIPSVAC